jgi:ankyrin repeat protein
VRCHVKRLTVVLSNRLQLDCSAYKLFAAFVLQDERALELLLKAGANPALTNSDMGEASTPLHTAASMGSPGMLRLLLASGKLAGAVSAPGEQGWTPLHLAARRGNSECVALLLEHGAARGAVTAQGKTALDIAKVNKRAAVAALLEARQ